MTDNISALQYKDEMDEHIQFEESHQQPARKAHYQSIYFNKTSNYYFNHPNQKQTATFGPSQSQKPDATQWLKKHSADPGLQDPKEFHYTGARKPPVPSPKDSPIHGLVSDVDFVKQNAKLAQFKIPKCNLTNEIDWTERKEFGETPSYLKEIKQQVRAEQAELQRLEENEKAAQQGRNPRAKAQKLSDDEKQQLLQGLKKNWEELNFEYITTTKSIVETFGQKERKQFLERRLAEIENDIILLEGGDVYVK